MNETELDAALSAQELWDKYAPSSLGGTFDWPTDRETVRQVVWVLSQCPCDECQMELANAPMVGLSGWRV